MMEIFSVYGIALVIMIIALIKHIRNRYSHPPGPLGIPFFGLLPIQAIHIIFSNYFPKITQKTYFKLMKEKYGDLWSIEMGGQRIVILASFGIVQEAFIKNGNVFSGKPTSESFDIISAGQGLLMIDGELWRDNREMSIKAFHDLGLCENGLENSISDEANILIEHLAEISTSPRNSVIDFISAESNVIGRIIFNDTNKYDDPEFESFLKDLKCAYQSDVIDTKCNFFPSFLTMNIARFLFQDIDRYFKAWANITRFVVRKCEKRKGNLSDVAEPSCIFDYFWKFRYQNEPETSYETRMLEISHSMSDLYTAGTDTANSLLRFCCLMLGRYPEVQKDLRNEIKNSTDNYKNIKMAIKKNCPKLLSFIDEIQRFCCLLPRFHRRVIRPCMLRGYQLRPEDIIIGDWGTISRDGSLFDDPDVFDPYRFMDKSRTSHVPSKYMIAYGIGKRSCLGANIASMELFLFLSRLILTFDISLPSDTSENFEDIFEGRSGLIHAPLDHEIKLHLL